MLVKGDSAVTRGVVELYAVPPDSLELADMPLLRRTSTDATGAYVFSWLPVPGGPWRLRAFIDQDGDLRAGDGEARRLVPDTLSLDAASPVAAAGVLTLYAPDTPGRLLIRAFDRFGAAAPVVFFSQQVSEADTGWTPQPLGRRQGNFMVLAGRTGGALEKVKPGANRLGAFVDVDGDTAFGAVPADQVHALGGEFPWQLSDPAGDTTGWYLEPLMLVPAPEIEAGLDTWMTLPDSVVVVVPWPAPDLPDSMAAAAADSSGDDPAAAAADTTGDDPEEP